MPSSCVLATDESGSPWTAQTFPVTALVRRAPDGSTFGEIPRSNLDAGIRKAPSVRPELAGPLLGANQRLDALADPDDTRCVVRSADHYRTRPVAARVRPWWAPHLDRPRRHSYRPATSTCAPDLLRTEALDRILCPCRCGGRGASCAVRNRTSRGIFAIPRLSPDFLGHPQIPPRSPQCDPQLTHRLGPIRAASGALLGRSARACAGLARLHASLTSLTRPSP
jgi:hypothetical protein